MPVVATAATGVRELVPTYVPGRQVPVEDAAALGAALADVAAGRFVPDPATHPLSEFSPAAAAAAYARLIGLPGDPATAGRYEPADEAVR